MRGSLQAHVGPKKYSSLMNGRQGDYGGAAS